ncbi:DUF2524 domain-containing protein [Paenibacillus sp. HWE-109]|uniref:DUF2524 domain-containing protein n=1 Tax=Paenibacillus sp. HWE-109 TaxID=1306526 RepID=UPI001EDD7D99|nr:DUF2524 domain-containing protein [Paenibacillus sp. HWE-109]UKS24155.1 DUF2524 domain-containing protein [Paenibacillus sp. HWE-109]
MLDQLESNYDCANAGSDLHQLKQELEQFQSQSAGSGNERDEHRNRLENQIRFIENKCSITREHNPQ